MTFVQVLFDTQGRIRRSTYWIYSLGIVVTSLALMYAAFLVSSTGSFFEQLASTTTETFTPFNIAITAISLLIVWPSYCLTVKRWHDRNRPYIFAVLYYALSYIDMPVAFIMQYSGFQQDLYVNAALAIIRVPVFIWAFIDLAVLDGTQGPNRYGPSPKGLGKDAIARAFD